jgi:Mn2+/Fe2+ NRAMP family transporter
VSEVFGFRKGVNLDFRRAPIFVSLFTGLLVAGALVALIPGLPVFALLIAIQALNGMLLPIILIFILKLINDRRLVGDLANGPLYNVLAWGTAILLIVLVAMMLGNLALDALGIDLFGGGAGS